MMGSGYKPLPVFFVTVAMVNADILSNQEQLLRYSAAASGSFLPLHPPIPGMFESIVTLMPLWSIMHCTGIFS